MGVNIEATLQSLTLEEKIALLAGKDFWETVPIPGKGVPAIKTSDGPNGARGEVFTGGTRAACFPAAVCSAATFNPEYAQKIGNALAEETKTKSARVLLAPTMCNHRHPLGGRNFESFSEDPLLAGKMAANVVKGVQERGIAATIKHFAANEQETERLAVDEVVSERALREIYMKPFEISVKEANPWGVMTAYNKINGTHADSHEFLLKQVLRGEWGWDGLVMSDWGGTNSTADALNAGLDLEMPGPTRHRSVEAVMAAVKKGEVTEETITERAKNVLKLIEKVGAFEDPSIPPEQSIVNPAHSKLIRDVAGQGITLLKNDNDILPLKKEDVKGKKIGLFGLAKEALIHGGGSASLNAHYRISPEEGLKAAYGNDVEFKFAKGAHTYRLLPPLAHHCTDLEGNSGWTLEQFRSGQTDKPTKTTHKIKESAFSPVLDVEAKDREVRLTATFVPTESGSHYLGCSGCGPTTVTINGEQVFEQKHNSPDPMGFLLGGNPEKEFTVSFEAGKSYKVVIHSKPPAGGNPEEWSILAGLPGFRMGFMNASEHDLDMVTQARDLAKEVDIALVFTGHTPAWETEGQDQLSFNLPRDGSQDKLVEVVSAANKKTIVINSTGVAIALPWLPNIAALVQAWFPGQEAGNAIADIISGAVNPSGRLPISWPKRIEDAPAYGNFPGEKKDGQLTVRYEEGVFVGYRHYDRVAKDKVHFPFGFGLSYTTFSLFGGHVAQTSSDLFKATVAVKNTGKTAGSTVVQLYVGRKEQSSEHPIKTLAAFKKTTLDPGQEKSVELEVGLKDFAYFNEAEKKWKVDKGLYDFSFGQSVAHVEIVATVEIEGTKEVLGKL
ncbi:beta-glucosidase [Parastagonospora nodorum]|uniref:beta-glucosidase n=1 Tax=Phaeosphaeria nodorum (strain SN15 / ATCC MYA-4574 / FGSC 10173) TaxID=321614 RepID=A0A7U2HZ34_PHANO|nr:beta-glucosidase [Parastagonospora nodorum]QRC93387.1 beta-glucosidase [Parastagonospora nodorum SN15]KAH3932366.1 beta-glucosidase [Parastagonospora nodorum]KAH3988370.1 beta-glucosidase [Parastagonospora nodorum]KAH4040343.1 beta-glucosidase [Parastagonospora nodorum]